MKRYILTVCAVLLALSAAADAPYRYVGGDISLLPEYEKAGAVYKDHDGRQINDLLPWLRDKGMNAMRVRLFVDPDRYPGTKDPNACQSLEYITPLCRKIVDDGFDLMLDFHYSDTWADPASQTTPEAWKDLDDDALCRKIYSYTRDVLLSLKEQGIVPEFIQPGNEISYGMLWGPYGTADKDLKKALMGGSEANWIRMGNPLRNAIRACREVCPDARIVIHTERVGNVGVQTNFYDKMTALGIDYDIIGLSYYPYFHGSLSTLDTALKSLQKYDRDIMIVETGYSYKWEVPGSSIDNTSTWPLSDAGQEKFAADLVNELEKYDRVTGLFWWWMEYNAYNTSLSGWYNAPLFDSTTGRATSALTTICSFAASNTSVQPVVSESEAGEQTVPWFDLSGRRIAAPRVPGIYLHGDRKVIVR